VTLDGKEVTAMHVPPILPGFRTLQNQANTNPTADLMVG
jgi:hypothetical protein